MEKQNPCETCSNYRESPLYVGNYLVYMPSCIDCAIQYELIKSQFSKEITEKQNRKVVNNE